MATLIHARPWAMCPDPWALSHEPWSRDILTPFEHTYFSVVGVIRPHRFSRRSLTMRLSIWISLIMTMTLPHLYKWYMPLIMTMTNHPTYMNDTDLRIARESCVSFSLRPEVEQSRRCWTRTDRRRTVCQRTRSVRRGRRSSCSPVPRCTPTGHCTHRRMR